MGVSIGKRELTDKYIQALEASHKYQVKDLPWQKKEISHALVKMIAASLVSVFAVVKTFDRIDSTEPGTFTMAGFQTEALEECVGTRDVPACELASVRKSKDEWRQDRWKGNSLMLAGTLISLFYTRAKAKDMMRMQEDQEAASSENAKNEARIFVYREQLENWGRKHQPPERPAATEIVQRIWKNAPC
ncbi:MAG TPA: hypothetical protein PKI93_05770 [Alphaproteobacteria bacterium]|nr:hypothetical protein [Alphaproteobacteria bacterium]HNS44891.1 hypothetical protein [Alphaproteobacteria bacterium]